MQKYKQSSINLLEPINQPNDTWTSLYNWVFKIGRYLLLGIEILVLIVFFSRFVLDKVNNDLTDEINDKVAILSNKQFRADEFKYRNIQSLLSDVTLVNKQQVLGSSYVASVLSSIPSGLTLSRYSYDSNRVTMNVLGSDLEIIRNYEFSLRQNSTYSNILFTITKSGLANAQFDVGISFNIAVSDK